MARSIHCGFFGRDIVELQAESRWGSGFFKRLSRDLQKEISNAKGFSENNLRYMKHFYELFPDGGSFSHNLWEKLPRTPRRKRLRRS